MINEHLTYVKLSAIDGQCNTVISGTTIVPFFSRDNNLVSMKVFNRLGKIVYQNNFENKIDKQTIKINFEKMTVGSYRVKITSTNYNYKKNKL